jgi:hypothetical protein
MAAKDSIFCKSYWSFRSGPVKKWETGKATRNHKHPSGNGNGFHPSKLRAIDLDTIPICSTTNTHMERK